MGKRTAINKKLREEEQQAIGAIYKQYIDTFQESSEIPSKTFVKSETLYAEQGKTNSDKGQLYIPKPIVKYKREESHSHNRSDNHNNPSRKRDKKKSNLRSLGDELKMLQHERQAKDIKPLLKIEQTSIADNDYTASTNLFVSNLSPHITETHLIQIFGTYGPLASVKIMWPRTEEASRSANCGFVAFMSRLDAERALNALKSREDMRINWGKSVKLPTHPIHIPPELYKLFAPPPPSGLPFNAQKADDQDLMNAVVKVTIPFDRNLLMLIHRMVEFVIREGPEFEAFIMTNEMSNSDYDFLFDYQSPAHVYYRWKLFSMLNGDQKNSWSMAPFRMYANGSIWVPPIAPNYRNGMPRELIDGKEEIHLSEAQTARLISLIKHLTIAREAIAGAMVFCLNHVSAIGDILEIITDSFRNPSTNPVKKIARLYLLSDVLINFKNRQSFTSRPVDISLDVFRELNMAVNRMSYARDKDIFKSRVLKVLRAWHSHRVFETKFINKFENIFQFGNETGEDDDASFNDEPLDGANLLKRSCQTTMTDCLIIAKSSKEKKIDMFNPCANLY